MLSLSKVIYVEYIFCYRDYVCQVSKLQHMYVIGLMSLTRDHKTPDYIKFKSKVLKQINPTIQINDFFDRSLFYKKNWAGGKKFIWNKLIYVYTYYILFVIIVTESDVSSNEIFFLTSQKGGGIASVNYLKVKNDVTYWNTIVPDRNQIRAAPNLLFLSS